MNKKFWNWFFKKSNWPWMFGFLLGVGIWQIAADRADLLHLGPIGLVFGVGCIGVAKHWKRLKDK